MLSNNQMFRSFVLCLTVLSGAYDSPARAVGYEASDEDDDMLQPDELDNSDVTPNEAHDSAFFLGSGVSFGQARSTEGGSSPGTSYLFRLTPGYQVKTGSWNRLELSAEFLYGQVGFRANSHRLSGTMTVPVEFGMLATLGYGYSLGSDIMAMARFGVGPLMGRAKGEVDGINVQSGASTGIGAQLGWLMAIPVGGSWDATGGLSLTHLEFDVGRLRGDGVSYNFGRTVIVNIPGLDLGIRYRF